MNEFNTIVNQLSSVEIMFNGEVWELIIGISWLLAFLPNNWELMREGVSNYVGIKKLIFNDVQDSVLTKEIYR